MHPLVCLTSLKPKLDASFMEFCWLHGMLNHAIQSNC